MKGHRMQSDQCAETMATKYAEIKQSSMAEKKKRIQTKLK